MQSEHPEPNSIATEHPQCLNSGCLHQHVFGILLCEMARTGGTGMLCVNAHIVTNRLCWAPFAPAAGVTWSVHHEASKKRYAGSVPEPHLLIGVVRVHGALATGGAPQLLAVVLQGGAARQLATLQQQQGSKQQEHLVFC